MGSRRERAPHPRAALSSPARPGGRQPAADPAKVTGTDRNLKRPRGKARWASGGRARMFGNVCWGCGSARRGASPSRSSGTAPAGGLPAAAPRRPRREGSARPQELSPPSARGARAGAARRAAPRARRRTRCVLRSPARCELPGSSPSARPGSERCGDALPAGQGSRDPKTESPRGPSCGEGGRRAEPGSAGLKLPSPGGDPAEPLRAPPRRSRAPGPDSCDHLDFANRAQPLGGKVPAVAAGGGQILTFSTRRPERERGGEKQEPPQRGQGPSSGARLHSFDLGRDSPFSKIKGVGEEKKKKVSNAVFAPLPQMRAKETILRRRSAADGAGGRRGGPLSAGSRSPGLGRVGNPGRAGAGCRRRRPPFSNQRGRRGGNCGERGRAQIRPGQAEQT